MTMLVYADCDPFAFVKEMEVLFSLHYEELCVTKDFPLIPDYDAYKKLADAGMLRCITVRADDEVIGEKLGLKNAQAEFPKADIGGATGFVKLSAEVNKVN